MPKPAIALALLLLLAGVLVACSESATSEEDKWSDCVQFMASQHTEALATNGCRAVLGTDWCATIATAMEWRVDNGQRIDRLVPLWERDC